MSDRTSFKIENADEVRKLLDQFPMAVRKRAYKTGTRKAGFILRRALRASAPKVSGNLRKSIKLKQFRNGWVKVGLMDRYYYETLDLQSKRGAPLRPWFEAAVGRSAEAAGQDMINELQNALYVEAGKLWARSTLKKRRR